MMMTKDILMWIRINPIEKKVSFIYHIVLNKLKNYNKSYSKQNFL